MTLRLERTRASKQFDGQVFRNPSGLGPGLQGQALADQTPQARTMEAILDAVADGWGDAAGWLRA